MFLGNLSTAQERKARKGGGGPKVIIRSYCEDICCSISLVYNINDENIDDNDVFNNNHIIDH
jgi:hypothetical protein